MPVHELARGAVELYLRSRPARVVALFLLGWVVLVALQGMPGTGMETPYLIDLDVYRIGGQVWLDGGDLYAETMPKTLIGFELPFTYPPIAAVLFSALTFLSVEHASLLLILLTCATLGISIWLLLRAIFHLDRADAFWVTVPLLAAALRLEPVLETLAFGQVNVLLMTLVIVDILVGRGRWWQGSLIGLAMAIKLTPAVFLAYFLMRKDWRSLAVGVGAALVYTGLGFLAAPSASVKYWTTTLRDPDRIGTLTYVSNQSLNGLLARFAVPDGALSGVWFVLCAALGLGLLWLMRRYFRAGDDVTPMVLMGVYALLASPVSWSHHWVWAIPPLLLLGRWTARGGRVGTASWVLGLFGLLALWNHTIWWFSNNEERELTWGLAASIMGNAYLWWALLFVVLAWFAVPAGAPDGAVEESSQVPFSHDQHE